MKRGGIACWDLVPLFRGVGIASAVCVFFCNCYYIMVLAWAIFYMFQSFKAFDDVLPWSSCNNTWAEGVNCYTPDDLNYNSTCHPPVVHDADRKWYETLELVYFINRICPLLSRLAENTRIRKKELLRFRLSGTFACLESPVKLRIKGKWDGKSWDVWPLPGFWFGSLYAGDRKVQEKPLGWRPSILT